MIGIIVGVTEIVKIAVFATGLSVFTDVTASFGKPRVAVARVIDNQIDDNADAALVSLGYKIFEILKRAVIGMYCIIIGYVILVVSRGGMNGHQPDAVKAHLLNIIKLCGNTVEVADTVVIGIVKAVNEDLIPVTVVIVDNIELYLVFVILLLCILLCIILCIILSISVLFSTASLEIIVSSFFFFAIKYSSFIWFN